MKDEYILDPAHARGREESERSGMCQDRIGPARFPWKGECKAFTTNIENFTAFRQLPARGAAVDE